MSVVNNLVWQDLCLLWDKNAGDMPFTMPCNGLFSIFYRGCKQSNLSTTAFGGLCFL